MNRCREGGGGARGGTGVAKRLDGMASEGRLGVDDSLPAAGRLCAHHKESRARSLPQAGENTWLVPAVRVGALEERFSERMDSGVKGEGGLHAFLDTENVSC